MSEAATLIQQARSLGATLHVQGDTVKVKAPAPLPAEVMEALRHHKAEIIRELTMPPVPPPPADPFAEAERVPRIVREKGCCLLWAEAVKDYVAFALNDAEDRRVPPGYVVYTLSELEALYGPGKKAPAWHSYA